MCRHEVKGHVHDHRGNTVYPAEVCTLWLQLQVINNIKQDVVKSLSLYYFTFVDIMDFKVRLGGFKSIPMEF